MAKILVADDEAPMREMLALACRMDGHEVVKAIDTPTTVSTYVQVRPDLLVIDLSMPGGGGAHALRQLRFAGGGKICPVIVVSGMLGELSDGQISELGATAVLEKPFTIDTLRSAVREALRGSSSGAPSS
jgi:DNA-binding response OmpR family regulator